MTRAASKASIPASLEPMEARLVSELPTDAGWQFEPKWDGFRCVVLREDERVDLQTKLVVEVSYEHVAGKRCRHGTKLLRWRPGKAPSQCTFEQLGREATPSKLITALLRNK